MTTDSINGGRTTEDLAGALRKSIEQGEISVGGLLPSIRQISEQNGVSSKTAHRALKSLASEGLIAAEPSRGYRVLPKANDPDANAPLAYILDTDLGPDDWNEPHRQILSALQTACLARGWSLLSIPSRGSSPAEIVDRLRDARAFGVALDMSDRDTVEAIHQAGIPAVMVDCGIDNVHADILIQDGQVGGRLAVEHLHQLGCKRLAWIGNTCLTAHSRERLSGALLGMRTAQLGCFDPDLFLDLDTIGLFADSPDHDRNRRFCDAIRDLLLKQQPPDGIVVLWMDLAVLVDQVAQDINLVPGRDFHLVSWAMGELLPGPYTSRFGNRKLPPTITWNVRTMAETAAARLAERRLNPELPFLTIKIPTQLRLMNEA